MAETTTKPYLIRALYEWCCDNGYTPHLAVVVDSQTRVPRQFVSDGQIVLNISPTATGRLELGNEWIEFQARFGGVAQQISVPVNNVSAIFARENSHGLSFEVVLGGVDEAGEGADFDLDDDIADGDADATTEEFIADLVDDGNKPVDINSRREGGKKPAGAGRGQRRGRDSERRATDGDTTGEALAALPRRLSEPEPPAPATSAEVIAFGPMAGARRRRRAASDTGGSEESGSVGGDAESSSATDDGVGREGDGVVDAGGAAVADNADNTDKAGAGSTAKPGRKRSSPVSSVKAAPARRSKATTPPPDDDEPPPSDGGQDRAGPKSGKARLTRIK